MVTWGRRAKRSMMSCQRCDSASASAGERTGISAMSLPAQNARPRPLSTTTDTSRAPSSCASESSRAPATSRFSALSASGRSSVSKATAPFTIRLALTSRSQIQLTNHVGLLQLGGRPAQRDVPRLEQVGAVGQLEGHGGVLLDEHDGEPAASQLANGPRDLADDDRRKPERGLVEQQGLGLRHEPAPYGQHLLLAAGERAPAPVAALSQ